MNISIVEPLFINQDKINDMTQEFAENGFKATFFKDRSTETAEIIARAQDAEVVVIGNLPFSAEVIHSLPKLKLLAVAFTGLDHVDMQACQEKGITVCNASGYSTINVAELTIGLIIDVLRNVTLLDPITRQGGTMKGHIGFDLCGKTVGIIGLGEIGQRTAKLLQAFGCRLLSLDRGKAKPKNIAIELTDMETLLKESDIISLHCPLNPSTKGLISAREFKLMKKSAFLINCARGPIVDEKALVEALENNEIAGAGLDVFSIEPPLNQENFPFLSMKNVVVTPHIAYATEEAFVRRADIVFDNILNWQAGTPKNVMN